MCGRYSLTTPVEGIRRLFDFAELPNLPARYNIAPTQEALVVRRGGDGRREIALLRWGLVPSWAKDPSTGSRLINARAKTVPDKPAFRAAFRSRRCLVVADGFYEWRKLGDGKQPYRVTLADGGPFAFAGLWERWAPAAAGEAIESFAIVTTDANARLRPIHERMPVILDPADHETWLDGGPAALALLRPFPGDALAVYAVDRRVNNPRHDDPACLAPLPAGADLPA